MMRTLNLTDPDNSQIQYKLSKFPDGQHSIQLTGYNSTQSLSSMIDDEVTIKARLNNFKDLEIIICVAQALKEYGFTKIHLFVPYILGARSDRKFSEGGFNYVKTVIAPIINLQGYSSVTCIDPHSDVLEACIDRFKKKDNVELVKCALFHITGSSRWKEDQNFVLVSPDAGALKKVYHVAEQIGYTQDIIIASKHRDLKTNQITHTTVPVLPQHAQKDFIIIDDICDGGRTFIEIAKVIKQHFSDAKIYLVVTHGIFSAGLLPLSEYFERVFTTTSFSKVDVNEHSDHTVDPSFLTQLDVFS